MKTPVVLTLLSGLCATSLAATASSYQQCGGKGFIGPTTCHSGLQCYCQSDCPLPSPSHLRSLTIHTDYSQCLSTDPKWTGCSSPSTRNTNSASTNSPSPAPLTGSFSNANLPKAAAPVKSAPTTPVSPLLTPGTCAAYIGSKAGYATTTHYYDGQVGACGCSTGTAMSPWQASPGSPNLYTAAGSQNLFAPSSPSSWCGSGCGKCYTLTNAGAIAASGQGDCTGAGDTITVMVTNLCPANGNEQWCAQPENRYGFGAHFDIMSQAGPAGWNNPVVKYEEVPCPGSLSADWQTCRCAGGKTSRVRRGLVGA